MVYICVCVDTYICICTETVPTYSTFRHPFLEDGVFNYDWKPFHSDNCSRESRDFPGGLVFKTLACQCKGWKFDLWSEN